MDNTLVPSLNCPRWCRLPAFHRAYVAPLAAGFVLLTTVRLTAHQPVISDGAAIDAASAIEIEDYTLSQVVYHVVTPAAPRVWLAFEVPSHAELFVQLGIPALDRLQGYRPALAVIGPGLPSAQLPFDVPAGLGAVVFDAGDVAQPRFFDEPFSGTQSWILLEETLPLPQAGRYYVVAFDPAGGTDGKFWVALGTREEFAFDDIAALGDLLPLVREFHELPAARFPCFLLPAGLTLTAAAAWKLMRRA